MTTEPTPVAYVISAVEGVADESTVKRYAELAGPAIEHFGGRFIVSNTEPVVVEGESPSNYLSMVEFPSMEDAKAWYNSPEYAEARDITPAAFRGRLLIFVEGVKTNQMPGRTKPPAHPRWTAEGNRVHHGISGISAFRHQLRARLRRHRRAHRRILARHRRLALQLGARCSAAPACAAHWTGPPRPHWSRLA